MIELLAHVDPFAAIMTGLWLFAAGMFPVGFMLGSQCSACCEGQPPCDACGSNSLPETLTVTFSGFADRTPGPDLITLSFESDFCYETLPAARVTAPGGDPATDKGPISAVTLTDGGSGYAKLGRVAPTLIVSGGSGSGATFTPTLSTTQDGCDLDFWSLASVAASGGEDYQNGEALTITIAEGDTVVAEASATVTTKRSSPTLGIDGSATLDFTLTDNEDGTWSFASVTVTDGGSGWEDNSYLGVTLGEDEHVEPGYDATLFGRTGRIEPTASAPYVVDPGGGSGAAFSHTLTETTITDGTGAVRPVWVTDTLTITHGGSGYAAGKTIYGFTDGVTEITMIATVSAVDGSGAITGVTVTQNARAYKSTGVLESVEVFAGGRYYRDTGEPLSVEVAGGGSYYREDADAPPYVATVTVTVTDTLPSEGSGAQLSVTIDDDTSSETFGQITGITIDDGGDDYLAWQWRNTKCCGDYYNGMSVVVKRNNNGYGPCVYSHAMCGVGSMLQSRGVVKVEYRGADLPPTAEVRSEVPATNVSGRSIICDTSFTATELVDCEDGPAAWDNIEFTSTGPTATVTSGGEYDEMLRYSGPRSCFICCKGEEPLPAEVEMDITSDVPGDPIAGIHVLPFDDGVLVFDPGNSANWIVPSSGTGLSVSMRLCAVQASEGFLPDPPPTECGDTCHRKCRVVVSINGASVSFVNVDSGGGLDCTCLDTPVCNPYGEYALCNANNTDDCPYTVTINAPL